jgi:hypothetical protein
MWTLFSSVVDRCKWVRWPDLISALLRFPNRQIRASFFPRNAASYSHATTGSDLGPPSPHWQISRSDQPGRSCMNNTKQLVHSRLQFLFKVCERIYVSVKNTCLRDIRKKCCTGDRAQTEMHTIGGIFVPVSLVLLTDLDQVWYRSERE